MRRWTRVLLALAVGVLLTPVLAWAHAAPVGVEPPHGARLDFGPGTVRISLTQPVELGFSRVTVTANQTVVSDPKALRLEGDRVMAQALPPLQPGRYDVAWRALSIDGHISEGSYYFHVLNGPGVASGAPVAIDESDSPGALRTIGIYGAAIAVSVGLSALLIGSRPAPRGKRAC